ncbi:DUF3017 domain-containing protein [Cellulomonas sp. zg-B12]|nr:DUF3017 domain-containing protein [Cellulomonas xiejunii]
MSTPARTPSAGLPGPVRPPRQHAPVAPAERAASEPVDASVSEPVPDAPAQASQLDARSIARASLAAGGSRSLWWTTSGIVASVAVAYLVDAVAGTYVLALVLLGAAIARALGREPGPVALAVRSRPFDVAMLLAGAVALAVLASVLPPG